MEKLDSSETNEVTEIIQKEENKEQESTNKSSKQSNSFWSNELIKKKSDYVTVDGLMDDDLLVPDQPYKLPGDFYWDKLSHNDGRNLNDLSRFLCLNYCKDLNIKFRRQYSPDFLKWTYKPYENIILTIRLKSNNVIIGSICGKVIKIQVNRNVMDMVEVDFLCVNSNLRCKGMSKLLIKELTRLFSLKQYKVGYFITGKKIDSPTCSYKILTRPLNIQKLMKTKFMRISDKISQKQIDNHYRLPLKSNLIFKKLDEDYIEEAYEIYCDYISKYNFYQVLDLELFKHIYMNNPFMKSFIVTNSEDDILEFCSYLQSTSKSSKYSLVKGYVSVLTCTVETPYSMIKNMLIYMSQNGVDIVDVPTIMDYDAIVYDLQFDDQNHEKNLYLYNWKINTLMSKQLGHTMY